MPSSFIDSVPPIVKALIELQPRSVIDIGPGWGKYGLLCREYLPDLERLVAVEVTPGRLPIQDVIYDTVIEADARSLSANAYAGFEVALLVDVIEHMTLDEGKRLLNTMRSAGCKVLVSTPKIFTEQHDDHNPYETHVSLWQWEDFASFAIGIDVSTIDSIIFGLGFPVPVEPAPELEPERSSA